MAEVTQGQERDSFAGQRISSPTSAGEAVPREEFLLDPPAITEGSRIERGSDDFLDFEWIRQRA